jgi:hypothetical protein
MNKKIYRIRDKKTGKCISLGYNNKTSWLVRPTEALKNASGHITNHLEDYEYVIYELVETKTEPII